MPFSSYPLQDISWTGQTQRFWVLRLKLPSAPSKNSTHFEYQTNATPAQEFLGLFFYKNPEEVFISTQGSLWIHSISDSIFLN
jgi:hypothetical protein